MHQTLRLGLWHSVGTTLIVEGGLWLLGLTLYVRVAHPQNRLGIFAFCSVVLLFTFLWYGNITDPPPRDPHTAPIFSLIILSLGVAWAYWINRFRPLAVRRVGLSTPPLA